MNVNASCGRKRRRRCALPAQSMTLVGGRSKVRNPSPRNPKEIRRPTRIFEQQRRQDTKLFDTNFARGIPPPLRYAGRRSGRSAATSTMPRADSRNWRLRKGKLPIQLTPSEYEEDALQSGAASVSGAGVGFWSGPGRNGRNETENPPESLRVSENSFDLRRGAVSVKKLEGSCRVYTR
jgi:hypothetical protein